MPKMTKTEILNMLKTTEKGQHIINTISSGLINNTTENFHQIFATLAKSNLQILLSVSFYTFEQKIKDPGKFNLNEVDFMADLFKVEFDVMLRFVHREMMKEKTNRANAKTKRLTTSKRRN